MATDSPAAADAAAGSRAAPRVTAGHAHGHGLDKPVGKDLAKLSLGALGVVYGDIGTSPLYSIRECFHGPHAVTVTQGHVYGVLSLVVWALVLVIVVKYLAFIMRADNRGEGGILALAALVMGTAKARRISAVAIPVLMGLFGAGLLYGEGLITPAVSILSAMEGLEVATDRLEPLIVPITAVILVGLFSVQRYGTGRIGQVFGWVMLVWFVAIGIAGLRGIGMSPHVLAAVSPTYAVGFFLDDPSKAFMLLGSVVLVVTGAEALYADMGHFGRRPIRVAWLALVMPCLLMNYFGQGALLLADPSMAENPFYGLAPGFWLYPMLVIATLAAIIASQALISGAFSLTRAAVQLGFFPRVRIVHTSDEAEGQIYIPEINWLLMIACLGLVFAFRTSSALAAAYGISVTGTMIISSILFYNVATGRWGWSKVTAGTLVSLFLCIDIPLFSANLEKLGQGGWFPLAIGLLVFTIMTTWQRGRAELAAKFKEGTLPEDLFLEDIKENPPTRVQGTAVFMTSTAGGIPPVLLHHLKHNKVLHNQMVLLSIMNERVPQVDLSENFTVTELGQGFFRVHARYGFMQSPNVPRLLARCAEAGLDIDAGDTSYYLGRESLLVSGRSRMSRWRKALFSFLSRNSRPATAFFHLPPNRVVELGAQIEL
jgi:KUP system potassium uptake protein